MEARVIAQDLGVVEVISVNNGNSTFAAIHGTRAITSICVINEKELIYEVVLHSEDGSSRVLVDHKLPA